MFGRLGYFTRETGSSLSRNFGMTVAGILTVFVSLFLFGGSLLLQKFVDHGVARWRGGVELEIFVNRPLILLADEPTGNLDPATSVGIMRLLDRINRTGTTVCMATHDGRIVDAMRRRVIELNRGTVVRDEARGLYGTGT